MEHQGQQLLVEVHLGGAGGAELHGDKLPLGAGLPLGQTLAVGVAGAGEVHKGAGHHLVQHVAGLLVADGHHLPVVEEVGDVRAVPGGPAAV